MFGKYKITDLIPQRDPIIVVDHIISANDTLTVTSFRIEESNIFCSGGCFQEPGLIENIAQAAAAGAGFERLEKGLDLIPGYIGGIKNLEVFKLPEVGEEIETTVEVIHTVFNVKIVYGEVRKTDGILCARCELKIFLSEEEPGKSPSI